MAITIKPMTKKQLTKYVAAYRDVFSDWSFTHKLHYYRINGPIVQRIWFENLRSGAYRPASAINLLVAPGTGMLHQFLDIKNREIQPREHEAFFPRVVRAMEDQFIPTIQAPLDPAEVCRLCENSASNRVHDAHFLSTLHAYLGNSQRAFEWLDILDELTRDRADELLEWERDRMEFGIELRGQMEKQNEKVFLDTVRQREQSRFLS